MINRGSPENKSGGHGVTKKQKTKSWSPYNTRDSNHEISKMLFSEFESKRSPSWFFSGGASQSACPSVFLCCLFSGGGGKKGGRGHRNRKPLLQNPRAQAKKKNFPHPPQQARRLVGKFWRLVGKLTTSWAGRESLRRDGARLVGTSWEAIQNHFD